MERINLRYWDEDRIKNLLPSNFVKRNIGDSFLKAIETEKVIILYGPRQTGKSSLIGWTIHQLLEKGVKPQNINYASMDYFDLHSLISDTRKLVKLLKEESYKKGEIFLFIDEIQRLENAGIILKQIYDSKSNIRIVVSGSSVFGIKDRISEFLTGRQITFILYPFSFVEFLRGQTAFPPERLHLYNIEDAKRFNDLYSERLLTYWNKYSLIGGYPEVVLSSEKKEWLFSSLFSVYLERDVGSLISKANFQKFQDFIRLVTSEVGEIYNRQSISRTLGRDKRTIEKFEDILMITFVLHRLLPFYTNARKEVSKAPRFYFIDMGLRNFILGESEKNFLTGNLLENVAVSELIKVFSLQGFKLHWWRSKGGAEVDVILKKENEIIPIEIKGIREKKPNLKRSFISFIERYHPKRAYFITNRYYENIIYKNTTVYFLPLYLIGFLKGL